MLRWVAQPYKNLEIRMDVIMLNQGLNVFSGPDSIREFLNPENCPSTPLVELPPRLNPFRQSAIRIFAKLAYLTPLLNIKHLPVFNMLQEAEKNGSLDGVHTIVENSSGNTGFSLAVMARVFGIQRVIAYVPFDIAPGKLDMLRLVGAQPELTRGAPGETTGIQLAKEAASKPGFFSLSQYENEHNPKAFEKWLAPEIWRQTEGKITVFAAGLGTTGTMLGATRYFRECPRKVTVVGAMCAPNQAVPGVRSAAKLKEISFDWASWPDAVMEVEARDSFKESLELCRSGIVAGPSSGFALAGLLHYLESRLSEPELDQLRNEDGEVVAAFVCSDTPLPYLDKYSTYLEAFEF
jgi:cysteine synthase